MKIIAHLDIDSFFPSAAKILNPELNNKPIGISSGSSRSIISSTSYEARKFGINAGMPIFQATKLCPNIIFVKPDFKIYFSLSTKLFDLILNNFTTQVERASIDECFIDFTNLARNFNDARLVAFEIQQKIKKELKLDVSIGISFNKFTAKMATNLKKPLGISVITYDNFEEKIGTLPIQKFFGIGKETIPKLKHLNINYIKDLATKNYDDKQLVNIFGIKTSYIIDLANGIGKNVVYNFLEKNKNISSSHTFSKYDLKDQDEIIEWLKVHAEQLTMRLSQQNLAAQTIAVVIRYSGSKDKRETVIKQNKLKNPIFTYDEIFYNAKKIFNNTWNLSSVRLIGIRVNDLISKHNLIIQKSIFDNPEKKENKVEELITFINNKFYKEVIKTTEKHFIDSKINHKEFRNTNPFIKTKI